MAETAARVLSDRGAGYRRGRPEETPLYQIVAARYAASEQITSRSRRAAASTSSRIS